MADTEELVVFGFQRLTNLYPHSSIGGFVLVSADFFNSALSAILLLSPHFYVKVDQHPVLQVLCSDNSQLAVSSSHLLGWLTHVAPQNLKG
jgi:hypothetical protein